MKFFTAKSILWYRCTTTAGTDLLLLLPLVELLSLPCYYCSTSAMESLWASNSLSVARLALLVPSLLGLLHAQNNRSRISTRVHYLSR